ncbi:MAG: hypothetical protein ACXAEU_05655 [Candidatus Hodarchaeales archaeon]|jgi:hypothetical protein
MVTKLIKLELAGTSLGMLVCFAFISLFALTQLYNGMQIIVLPLWGGALGGATCILLVDRHWPVNSLKRINQILKPLIAALIIFYVVVSILILLGIVFLDFVMYFFVSSFFTGFVSGILITACLRVYLLVMKESKEKKIPDSEIDRIQ